MYLPTHFKQENLPELFDLIEQHSLASVIVTHDGKIEANHIPLELDSTQGELGVLKGHIAKENPLFEILDHPVSAYVIFQAEQAYISPNGYAGKHEHHRVVPTWNYRVVHVKGMIRKVTDEKHLRGILARLTRQHEAAQPMPWKMGDAPEDFMRDQLSKIAAVEIEIISMVGKFKVSQNRTKPDAEGAAQALEQSHPEMSQSIRRHFPEQ